MGSLPSRFQFFYFSSSTSFLIIFYHLISVALQSSDRTFCFITSGCGGVVGYNFRFDRKWGFVTLATYFLNMILSILIPKSVTCSNPELISSHISFSVLATFEI